MKDDKYDQNFVWVTFLYHEWPTFLKNNVKKEAETKGLSHQKRKVNLPVYFPIFPHYWLNESNFLTRNSLFLPISYCFGKRIPISHKYGTFFTDFVLFCQKNTDFVIVFYEWIIMLFSNFFGIGKWHKNRLWPISINIRNHS